MSKSNIIGKTIQMPVIGTYHVLCIKREKGHSINTIMTIIDEEEEKQFDNIKDTTIILVRDNKTFRINVNQIFCYGEVNFRDNSDDLNVIENFKFLSHLGASGIPVRYGYDYQTHTCTSPGNRVLWTETWSSSLLAQIAHATLGKPERIILFNHKS